MSQLKKTLLELKCFMELSDLLMIFLPQMMEDLVLNWNILDSMLLFYLDINISNGKISTSCLINATTFLCLLCACT